LPRLDARAIGDPVIRMQHDTLSLREPVQNLSISSVLAADLDETQLGSAVVVHEDGPSIALSEQRRERHAQLVFGLPHDDSRLDAISVTERLPLLMRARDIDDRVDALFLDAERGHLREAK